MNWREKIQDLEEQARKMDEKELGWESLEGRIMLNLICGAVIDLMKAMEEVEKKLDEGR